jgi:hypothetical protein
VPVQGRTFFNQYGTQPAVLLLILQIKLMIDSTTSSLNIQKEQGRKINKRKYVLSKCK